MTAERIKAQADKVFTLTMPMSVAACAAAIVFQAFGGTASTKADHSTDARLASIETRMTSLELQAASIERQQREDRNSLNALLYDLKGAMGRIEGKLEKENK